MATDAHWFNAAAQVAFKSAYFFDQWCKQLVAATAAASVSADMNVISDKMLKQKEISFQPRGHES